MTAVRQKFTIGRDRGCDIPLADDSVSGRHAELEFLADGKLLLVDCQSTNGTYLVGAGGQAARIRQTLVSPLDQVRFGAVTLKVGDIIAALRLKAGVPAPGASANPAATPAVQGQHLIRCACGGIKAVNEPCPECGR